MKMLVACRSFCCNIVECHKGTSVLREFKLNALRLSMVPQDLPAKIIDRADEF